jgi:hypothetical protein
MALDKNARQREHRRKTNNAHTTKYERTTPKGFLVRVYRNMLSRVRGIQRRKAHLYVGREILPKAEFYAWALAQESFWLLWHPWQAKNRPRDICPSIDRINADLGYTIDNMQWLTHGENSGKATTERYQNA